MFRKKVYLGALNDINIVKIDPFIIDLVAGKYKDVEFSILKRKVLAGTWLDEEQQQQDVNDRRTLERKTI